MNESWWIDFDGWFGGRENELAGLSELCYDTRAKVIWEREEGKEEETTTNNREFSPQELEKLKCSGKNDV